MEERQALTLRMPPPLKAAVARAANAEGISVNAWITLALARCVRTQETTSPNDCPENDKESP